MVYKTYDFKIIIYIYKKLIVKKKHSFTKPYFLYLIVLNLFLTFGV